MTKKERAAMEDLTHRVVDIEVKQKWLKWEATLRRSGWTDKQTWEWYPPKAIAKVYDFDSGYSLQNAVEIHKSVLGWNKSY